MKRRRMKRRRTSQTFTLAGHLIAGEVAETVFAGLAVSSGERTRSTSAVDADVAAALGLTKTEPANTATVVKLSQKALLKTGKAARVRATVYRDVTEGGATVTKSRQVPLICEIAKLNTIAVALKDKTLRLGDQNLVWTIGSVNFG
jgi:hypothetical protein